ncbi:AAA domain-containing protein [Sporosarcina aquimarina]|uniref:AAA domain-containing protein n=2 Tax=Sporosarcina aquimarina TaxID=114975 RepID=A0ABU4G2T3_9BACL|nr:AAA domain-containing protein [Sporosarcina aquimarina]
MNRSTFEEMVKCELTLTTSARKGIEKITTDEHAFFAMQKSFSVHIEKRPENQHGSQSFSFFFDPESNEKLSELVDGRVPVLECVVKNDGFLATGFHVRGKREPVATNRRLKATIKFKLGKSSGLALPIDFATHLRELPIAEERSEYVKKRIGGWEGYLRIMEKNADVEDLHTTVQTVTLSEDFRLATVQLKTLPGKAWKSLPGFSAKFDGLGLELGNVVNTDRKTGKVEIELKNNAIQQARKTGFRGKQFESIVFSNFAELSQVRRLRRGFKDLQDGLAANANLEKILFEERPVVKITNRHKPMEFETNLNEYQREAVSGAMNASDLYVIQGPPGTGKTTVISEICNQAVKSGMRTLVASQANLAVDNALGRLLHHQDIRILRYGRTESIEEEGRKFIEENVAEHWRTQTLQSMESELQKHNELETTLRSKELSLKENIQELTSRKEQLSDQKKLWDENSKENNQLTEELKELERQKQVVLLEIEKNNSNQRKLEERQIEATEEMDSLRGMMKSQPNVDQRLLELENEKKKIEERIDLLKKSHSISEMETQLSDIQLSLRKTNDELAAIEKLLVKLAAVGKLNDLNNLLDEVGFVPDSSLDSKMTELIRQIDRVQEVGGEDSFTAWSDTNARVDKAIKMVTEVLQDHQFHNRIRIPKGFRNRHSLQSIQETVSRVGRYLMQPTVQKLLSTKSFSVESYDALENLTKAVDLLHDRKNFISSFLIEAQSTAALFEDIKQSVMAVFNDKLKQAGSKKTHLRNQLDQLTNQLTEVQQISEESAAPEKIAELLSESEKSYQSNLAASEELHRSQTVIQTAEQNLEIIQKEMATLQKDLVLYTETQTSLLDKSQTLDDSIQLKKDRKEALAEKLIEDPNVLLQEVIQKQTNVSDQLQDVQKQLSNVPVIQSIQKMWHSMLTEASAYDLDEIRKLYVKHANVIGTTCVASARKEFVEDYPEFDLVIIDEVSKATPPELLLPMLKGKKIILVGDHHQLPPLVGQETMEEFLEEMPDDEQKKDMERLLKESLFERLFRTLPKQNKTMLGIQYRMHEKIMKSITPFYNENGYALQCGLPDSDQARSHHLETSLIKSQDHLLWIDQSNAPNNYEAKPKGGTSRYNESELTAIRSLLGELDEATAAAIESGTFPSGTKKEVGVISFYGEQVKRINQIIQEDGSSKHLTFRTGSVDKFQGMEMDIIIVSFVRNHGDSNGDIGFARDYRRLNVALSRAKELLIIVGSSEMFVNNPKSKQTRDMYRKLYREIESQGGIRSLAETTY